MTSGFWFFGATIHWCIVEKCSVSKHKHYVNIMFRAVKACLLTKNTPWYVWHFFNIFSDQALTTTIFCLYVVISWMASCFLWLIQTLVHKYMLIYISPLQNKVFHQSPGKTVWLTIWAKQRWLSRALHRSLVMQCTYRVVNQEGGKNFRNYPTSQVADPNRSPL